MHNKKSLPKGLSGGESGDSRDVEDKYLGGDAKAELAIRTFCYRLAKYIGSYVAVPLQGSVDVIAFAGGIGEKSSIKRGGTIRMLEKSLGLKLDEERNQVNGEGSNGIISQDGQWPVIMVVPTNEELMIAKQTFDLCTPLV